MYAHFRGVVAEKGADCLVIDCGGVGDLLTVSAATLSAAPAVGQSMTCYAALSVREDAMELFGFYSKEEKHLFLKLRGVTGVGPKSAMQILSTLSVRDLTLAIVTGDAAAIARAPGVGKKTAQRVILELRDKVEDDELVGDVKQIAVRPGAAAAPDACRDAVEALITLGYQRQEAVQAVAAVQDQSDRAEELIRLALKGMMR